jgi:hypothetical protein
MGCDVRHNSERRRWVFAVCHDVLGLCRRSVTTCSDSTIWTECLNPRHMVTRWRARLKGVKVTGRARTCVRRILQRHTVQPDADEHSEWPGLLSQRPCRASSSRQAGLRAFGAKAHVRAATAIRRPSESPARRGRRPASKHSGFGIVFSLPVPEKEPSPHAGQAASLARQKTRQIRQSCWWFARKVVWDSIRHMFWTQLSSAK